MIDETPQTRWEKLRSTRTTCPLCKKPQRLVKIAAESAASVYRHEATGGLACDDICKDCGEYIDDHDLRAYQCDVQS